MERVSGDGFFSYRNNTENKSGDTKRTRKSGKPRSFLSALSSARTDSSGPIELTPEAVEAETGELVDAVFEAGDRLKRHTDRESLGAYKEAVRRFLSAVVRRGVDIDEQTSGSHILKRKRYSLVKVVDQKLEQLAAGVLATQRNQLDILARIDEINGLIVDLKR